tara:strand:+ start:17961 stop:18560 length:600 start_codon:yes stop_codon:yes gene_type:complete
MTINLDKKNNKPSFNLEKDEVDYYYSTNGKQYGPYLKKDLLTKIDSNTLVWREGIEWTNASKLEEFNNHFQSKVPVINNSDISLADSEVVEVLESNNITKSQKMFSSPFSFSGRIRRLEYGISFIIYYVAVMILPFITIDAPILGLGYIPTLWFLFAQGTKRCHDRGNPGWWQIIPFYGFWMIFAEGEAQDNEYGSSPK